MLEEGIDRFNDWIARHLVVLSFILVCFMMFITLNLELTWLPIINKLDYFKVVVVCSAIFASLGLNILALKLFWEIKEAYDEDKSRMWDKS